MLLLMTWGQYEGWIERDGMKAFSFDGKQAPRPISYGSYSLAGRTAGEATMLQLLPPH